MEDKERANIVNALTKWANSLNELDSEILADIGIDDSGDLRDMVSSIWRHENEFWILVGEIEEGKYAS